MTKDELARIGRMTEIGCIACLLINRSNTAGEIHHLTEGGRRLSHFDSVCLCPYHHRGVIPPGHSRQSIMGIKGPSVAFGRKCFAEWFGSDAVMLEIQEILLKCWELHPWPPYNPPYEIRSKAIHWWTRNRNA